jgi:hypothetical protein
VAIVQSGNCPNVLLLLNANYKLSLTFFAPFTMLISFNREAHLAVWLKPQSGATDNFSAGTYFKHR